MTGYRAERFVSGESELALDLVIGMNCCRLFCFADASLVKEALGRANQLFNFLEADVESPKVSPACRLRFYQSNATIYRRGLIVARQIT